VKSLAELALPDTATVVVRRIGEPVQVDHEALSLLTSAGLLPGQRVDVRREDGRVIAVREGAEEASGVSLPTDVAAHVFAALA
jgi:DtxR family Mn-dependent transcriptional regulator